MSEKNGKQDVGQVEDLPSVIVDESALNDTGDAGNVTTEATEAPAAAPTGETQDQDSAADAAEEEFVEDRTGNADVAEDEDLAQDMIKREQHMKLAGKIAIIVVAVVASLCVAFGIMSVVRESVKGGMTMITGEDASGVTVVTPAMKGIDASGCKPGQYRLEGNTLVFKDCAIPIFGDK